MVLACPAPLRLLPRPPSIQFQVARPAARTKIISSHYNKSISTTMPSSDPNALNAAGLKPEESRVLSERAADLEPHEQKIIEAIKELYSCKPTATSYDIYTSDAVFHDPVGIAQGKSSIRAQFDALPKLFSHANIEKFRILTNPPSTPDTTILIDQDIAYFRHATDTSPFKTVNSLLTLQVNGDRQVTRHTEEWGHKRETTGEDGFLGMLNEGRKKISASLTNLMMGKGDEKK